MSPAFLIAGSYSHQAFHRKAIKENQHHDTVCGSEKAIWTSLFAQASFLCHADFLSALKQPKLPAADMILRCFLATVNGPRGLKHQDNGVKQICIDLISLVGQRIFLLAKEIGEKASDVEQSDKLGEIVSEL